MHILFTSSSFGGGGITSYAHELIRCYNNAHQISVLIGDDSVSPITESNVKVYKLSLEDISYQNALKAIDLITNTINPDVIINSHADLITLITPYLPEKIRIISVSHSLKYVDANLAGFNSDYVDGIVALSEHAKEHLIKKFGIKDESKVHVIFNFVQDYPNAGIILRGKFNNELVNIVFAGGNIPVKSPDIAMAVVRKLQKTNLPFKLYWLGSRQASFSHYSLYDDIKQMIPEDERIVFTGKLPRDKAQEIILKANIYLFPSRREGCPMSLIEAMRVGTIPIVADYPHANIEIIEDGRNGFVIGHNDINGYVNRITDIIINHQKYSYIYNNCYEYFLHHLSYDQWKNKMNDLLQSVKNNHNNPRTLITEKAYAQDCKNFMSMQRKSHFQMIWDEYVPHYLKMNKLYLTR